MKISGTLRFGETDKFDAEVSKQLGLVRSDIVNWLCFFLVVGAPFALCWFLWRSDAGAVFGLMAGMGLWIITDRQWDKFLLRKQFALRGVAEDYSMSVSLSEMGLVYEDQGVSSVAKWSQVSQLLLIDEGWFFVVQVSTFCHVPRRLFGDENSERAFIAEALSYMSEEARARSKDAVEFAAAPPA